MSTSDFSVPPGPTLLVICGGPGTGKTTWAQRLEPFWPRPLLVWDLEMMDQDAVQSSVEDPRRPRLSNGLPVALPDGWDVAVVVGGMGLLAMTRAGAAGQPDACQRMVDWSASFAGQRALALVTTDQILRQTGPEGTNRPSERISDRLTSAWRRRFAESQALVLPLGATMLDRPYDAILTWRRSLDAKILRQVFEEEEAGVPVPPTLPRARL